MGSSFYVFSGTFWSAAVCSSAPPPPPPPSVPHCASVSIPTATFRIPQSYRGNTENFDWLISPTTLSTATPAGDAACPKAVYIGQYSPDAASPFACINTAPTVTTVANGCGFRYEQTDNSITRILNLTVACDPLAYNLQPPPSIVVTAAGSSSYVLSGTFWSAAVCSSAP